MKNKGSWSFLADHPIVVILGLIASILGILGFSLRDIWFPVDVSDLDFPIINKNSGWVEKINIRTTEKELYLRTVVPDGRVYDLLAEINPILYIHNNKDYIMFDVRLYTNNSDYPAGIQIANSGYDPLNEFLEPAGFSDINLNSNYELEKFEIGDNYTIFVRNPEEGFSRLHFDISYPSSIDITISFIRNGTRFDGLVAP